MKKNLKIVSAAAAALLAVAPVAASAVASAPVFAADNGGAQTEISWNHIPSLENNADVNLKPSIQLSVANPDEDVNAALSGTITASIDGHDYTGTFVPGDSVTVYRKVAAGTAGAVTIDGQRIWKPVTNLNHIHRGLDYYVQMNNVSFNLGTSNANKAISLHMDKGNKFQYVLPTDAQERANAAAKGVTSGVNFGPNGKVWVNSKGTVTLKSVFAKVTSIDLTDLTGVHFADRTFGNDVTTGSLTENANNQGNFNVNQLAAAATKKYTAYQVLNDDGSHEATRDHDIVTVTNDIKDALKKANISVDANGWFKAPHTLNFNLNAKSVVNGATATLPVTVTFSNVAAPATPDEYAHTTRVWNVKESYIYSENHHRMAEGMRYKIGSGHNVVADANGAAKEYTIGNGVKAYKLADGHYKGDYVDVRNFANHRVESNKKVVTTRARIFTASGRVVGKHNYVNAGVRVKVSGTKTIKGHKMYRIATNRYIKAANVRNA